MIISWLTAIALFGAPSPASIASETAILSVEIDLRDWGLANLSEAQFGQVGVARGEGGDILNAYRLSKPVVKGAIPANARRVPSSTESHFVVSLFDDVSANRLGGVFNAFQRHPSSATASLESTSDGRRALSMAYDKKENSYCGLWIHLFDSKAAEAQRIFFDAKPLAFMSFWIRGGNGGEKILLRIADAEFLKKEDSLPIGEAGQFLPSGRIESYWQQAVVPIEKFPARIRRDQLAVVVLEAAGAGAGRIELKSLAFGADRRNLPSLPPLSKSSGEARTIEKAIWAWNTRDLLADEARRDEFADFLAQRDIQHVYLQIPPCLIDWATAAGWNSDLQKLAEWIGRISERGIRVHALDGDPHFILPEQRSLWLRRVDNAIRFNRMAKAGMRFYGVHFDVEPHALPGFNSARQEEFLRNFLESLAEGAERAQGNRLYVGVDIPSWYDAVDEWTGEPLFVDFRGERKTAAQHVIDIADGVVAMNYRTKLSSVTHLAAGMLGYAAKWGKSIVIGLETAKLPDETVYSFRSRCRPGLPSLSPADRFLIAASREGKTKIYLLPPNQFEAFKRRILEDGMQSATFQYWPIDSAVIVSGDQLSFYRLGCDSLWRAMEESLPELRAYPSFAGFAIHDYLGLKKLVERR
ncbi:MAG: hypothetical protein AB1656_24405 [Candidatus Omnitrophota bacterium]